MYRTTSFLIIIFILVSCKQENHLLFIGSFTENKPAAGLTVHSISSSSGISKPLYKVDSLINPSFLQLSTDQKLLFAITESRMEQPGALSSFKIHDDRLEQLSKVSTQGRNPVHIAVSPDGNKIAVSNYTDAGIAFYHVDSQGNISEKQLFEFQDSSIIEGRQDEAHIHSSNFSVDGRFLFAHDLGGDKIRVFEAEDSLKLRKDLDVNVAAGSGPRHFTFDRSGNFGYLMNELAGRIDIFDYDQNAGTLKLVGSQLTYEDTLDIYRSADIHITHDNRHLMVTNRGPAENTIVVYKISEVGDGSLKEVDRMDTGGSFPRNFAISTDGLMIIVANRETNNVTIFPFDPKTGKIGEKRSEIKIHQPSSVQIL